MGWIKRNLFFVVGGSIALVLLGGAGFLTYKGWSRNSEAYAKLDQIDQKLTSLAQQKPGPGDEKTNNTDIAKQQERELRAWLTSAKKYFMPVAGIPAGNSVTSKDYAEALRRTIDALKRQAESASVTLPPDYQFSFKAQQSLVKFAPGSLDLLAVQLGEVKAISEILFSTRINALVGIQRVRVSEDDSRGQQSDYMDQRPLTNDLAILTPYIVTFRCFTPELARVVTAFAATPNTFLIKSINVQPAGGASTGSATAEPTPANDMQAALLAYRRAGQPAPPVAPPVQTAKGGLQTVLKEQLLQVAIEVEVVKLLPKS